MDAEILGFSITHTDPSVSPAQDFYRFAAGSWLDRAEIPDTESQLNGVHQAGSRVKPGAGRETWDKHAVVSMVDGGGRGKTDGVVSGRFQGDKQLDLEGGALSKL